MILAILGLYFPATSILVLTVAAALAGHRRWLLLLAVPVIVLFFERSHLHQLAVVSVSILAALAAAVVLRVAFTRAGARRHYPAVIWARIRWRWLMRNLGLGWRDRHIQDKIRKTAMFPVTRNLQPIRKDEGRHLVRYPRVRMRPDEHGIVARVRTIPGTGRKEFETNAQHIADAWRCERVQVSQRSPGRLIVRGLRVDPLVHPFGPEDAPAGSYTGPVSFRPYLGRDEWGEHRHVLLGRNLTGVTIAGLPGYGKTSLVLSLLMQLADTGAVQFVFIDGKGGGDYSGWHDRAWLFCGDDLRSAVTILEDVHVLMRQRLGRISADRARPRNGWPAGPTVDNPLIVTVIDECHTFFDAEAVKGDKQAEPLVRAARALTGQLVRKSGSVLFLTILITQKQTSDAIPTSIRDNCGLGLSFGVKTKEAAVAGLGESIREYPSYCPTLLREPQYVGCATATLSSGVDPFVRLRVPEISEEAAAERARATEQYRRDPALEPVTAADEAALREMEAATA